MRRLAKIAGIIAGVLAVLIVALQIVLNSRFVRNAIDKAAAENINGSLRYSRIHFSLIKAFPRLRVDVDSLSITYPHELFAQYDGVGAPSPLLAEGRGAVEDTLVSLDRFSAAVNLWRLFAAKVRVHHIEVDHPLVYYHAFDSTATNLDIFGDPRSQSGVTEAPTGNLPAQDTVSKPSGLPWLSIGRVAIGCNPHIVYTSQADTVYADIKLDSLFLKGNFRIKKDRLASKVKRTRLQLDSLVLSGRLPADTLNVWVDNVSLAAKHKNVIDLGLNARMLMISYSLGHLKVPVDLDTRVAFRHRKKVTHFRVPHFNADLAYIPLRAHGKASVYADRTEMNASAAIDTCNLEQILEEYAVTFLEQAKDVWTDARLSLQADVKGTYSETSMPDIKAALQIPKSLVLYKPKDLLASVDIDVSGGMTPQKVVSADVETLKLHTEGFDFDLDGRGNDLIGEDPQVDARLVAYAVLDSLMRLLPENVNVDASGRINFDFDVKASLAELEDYNFSRTRVNCSILSDAVRANVPESGIKALLNKPDIRLASHSSGITLTTDIDSVAFEKGPDMAAHVKSMLNVVDYGKVTEGLKKVPRISFMTNDRDVFFRSGDMKAGVTNAGIALEARERGFNPHRRKRLLDSLQRVYPGTPRDSLIIRMRARRAAQMAADDFASKDLDFGFDSTVVRLLNAWRPAGRINVEKGWVSTPSLPLETRLNAFDVALNDDNAELTAFNVSCGSSDIGMTGTAGNFRRFIRRRGPLKFQFDLSSNYVDANQILVATGDTAAVAERPPVGAGGDGASTVIADSDRQSQADSVMKAFVVPGNLEGTVNMRLNHVKYSTMDIRPVKAQLNIADRCIQLKEFKLDSNVGGIEADAFYASRKLDDISLGADFHLLDMSAGDIIHMLPSVDEMMPVIKSFEGKFNCMASITTQLDTNMNVIFPTAEGLLRIGGRDLYVSNAGSLRKVTRLLLFRNKNIGEIRDLDVEAVLKDNKLEVYPFILGVDRYTLALMGKQRLDGEMKYNVSIIKSILPFRFGINIFGTMDNWKFSLGRSKYKNDQVPSFSEGLDTMHVNILDGIRNVYRRGVKNAMAQTALERQRMEAQKTRASYSSEVPNEPMSTKDYMQLDSMIFAAEAQEDSVVLHKQLEVFLASQLAQTDSLAAEWAAEHPLAAKILSRREQRRQEKAAAAEAKKQGEALKE
ncbi:MAG: hypothetical protein J5632_02605 [Bacteroidales bacterium]|nr:hypothetical protein [Bacteroidales bacterium]